MRFAYGLWKNCLALCSPEGEDSQRELFLALENRGDLLVAPIYTSVFTYTRNPTVPPFVLPTFTIEF